MGAIAEAIVAYAQPLIDATDGSMEQVNRALAISQACWNIAILPEQKRQSCMDSIGQALSVEDAELDEFQHSILEPMIRRHEQMFPGMHQLGSQRFPDREPSPSPFPAAAWPRDKSAEPGRYDPCPCNSGEKYKFCCGRASRKGA
jgi:uncharacterized protein YecA (UPF0149 family)